MLSLRYQKCLGIIVRNWIQRNWKSHVAYNKIRKVQESKKERKKERKKEEKWNSEVIIRKRVRRIDYARNFL